MNRCKSGLKSAIVPLLLILALSEPASAQGSIFSVLSGTVVDTEGLPIPGANVKIKNLGTGQQIDLVSSGDGGFTAPNITSGKYAVTVELAGFRTTTLDSVSVAAGIPTAVKVTLQVGTIAENITVVGESATVVQTQSPAISTNLTGQQITSLPLTSRNALDSLTSLPGFNTSGTARNSTVSGLPRSAINITLDGMSVQDNYLKTTDGYFARLSPLLDSVEEVTVTTAGNTADATGQGAVQIRFVTKSGTNQWIGTAYEYLRHDALNANTWFRNRDLPPDPATGKAPKNELRNYQHGIAQGGPLKRNKAFFFFNYEEQRSPSSSTLQRVILTPEASSGIFSYNAAGGVQRQNLLQIAANAGQLSTIDPTIAKILADIQSATRTTGGVTALNNPLVQQYTWSMPTKSFNPSPTARLDYEITRNHRLTGSFNYRKINSVPDTTNNAQLPFPNSLTTGSQRSTRWTTSESLRSTFGDSLFNELRAGGSGGATLFSPELGPDMWSNTSGYRLNFNAACCGTGAQLTNPSLNSTQSSREASTTVLENTTTWLKGRHNIQFGALMVQADVWLQNQTLVPTAEFGLIAGQDPADAIFNATTLPGASAADITQAKNLYAILTGRLSRLTGDARINAEGSAYQLLGRSRAEGRMREFNVFVSDSWRAGPSLTVSGGVRYVLQNPFYPTNDSYTTLSLASLYGISGEGNIHRPGTLTGTRPRFVRYTAGQYAYRPDRNNVAPSLGAAWQVPASTGFMKWLRGSQEGDAVVRGGWAMAFQRPGMSDFTGVFGDNQGIQVALQTDQNTASIPILLRNTPALPGPPAVNLPAAPASLTTRGNAYDPDIQLPYTQSWSMGWQRKVSDNSAIELRYVGSRHRQSWDSINLNEPNINSNGFLNEFRLAQANLQANIAGGRGATFAYMGPGTGTNPLPIMLAHFNAQPTGNAANQALYTGANWTSATFLGFLAARNPNPWGFASLGTNGLIGNTTLRNNAVQAGLPANFFVANPDLLGAGTTAGAANLTTNMGGTRAHSMQFEYRKRLSNGFSVNSSYTWSRAEILNRYGFNKPLEWVEQAGQVGNVRHAVKANFAIELPVGRDRHFGSGMHAALDAIVGGWSLDGVVRLQTGEVIDFGNVRLVGMTKDELQDAIRIQQGPGGQIFILPADILDNTVKAFSVSATSASGYGALGPPSGRYFAPANGPDCLETAPGYGDCGARSITVNGPPLFRVDLGVSKKFDLPGRFAFEFRGEMLNALNNPYFNPASTAGIPLGFTTTTSAPMGPGGGTPISNTTAATNVDNYRLTALLGDNPSRIVQLVWRVRW
ncbi:MAG TPA: carboxypeptidase regulatory-like domain-containing protein [Vicinamibacterales bacterium]|nr:carboxypeptidase regulatory-like domain-containing protein [Vicinamibacterales bacterium]